MPVSGRPPLLFLSGFKSASAATRRTNQHLSVPLAFLRARVSHNKQTTAFSLSLSSPLLRCTSNNKLYGLLLSPHPTASIIASSFSHVRRRRSLSRRFSNKISLRFPSARPQQRRQAMASFFLTASATVTSPPALRPRGAIASFSLTTSATITSP